MIIIKIIKDFVLRLLNDFSNLFGTVIVVGALILLFIGVLWTINYALESYVGLDPEETKSEQKEIFNFNPEIKDK